MQVSKLGAFTGLLLPEVGQDILWNRWLCSLCRATCWTLQENAVGKTMALWLPLGAVLALRVESHSLSTAVFQEAL